MNKKALIFKICSILFCITLFCFLTFVFNKVYGILKSETYISINMEGSNLGIKPIEIFYKYGDEDYTQENSFALFNEENKEHYSYNDKIKINGDKYKSFRIDLGDNENEKITIKNISYRYKNLIVDIKPNEISQYTLNQLEIVETTSNYVILKSTGNDPFISFDNVEMTDIIQNGYIYSAIVSAIIVLLIWKFISFESIYFVLKDLYIERRLIRNLAFNDFKTRFAGSYFGIIWAYVQPICTIFVFWFVFQVGFRNPNVGNVEYVLWFMTGLVPWFFFSEAWNSATNSFMEYSYLVKKVVFKINILPIIKVCSAFFIHMFFILFMIVVYAFYNRYPTIYYFQIIYYSMCMVALVISLSFITAPLILFFKDLGQIISIILQFGMWLTPIMWSVDNLPVSMKNYVTFFKINPMYYVVQGYRDSMIYNVMFYDKIIDTVYFWFVIIALTIIGNVIYKRLKPHFADVL